MKLNILQRQSFRSFFNTFFSLDEVKTTFLSVFTPPLPPLLKSTIGISVEIVQKISKTGFSSQLSHSIFLNSVFRN